jgi:hypothetical protein
MRPEQQIQQWLESGGVLLIVGVLLAWVVVALAVLIPYLLTLQRAINRCSPECRAMTPGLVWLYLIPCFALVWNFFIVINVAKSLDAEFRRRGIPAPPNPSQGIGLAVAILRIVCIIPYVNCLAFPAWFVCLIIHWIQVAGYSKQLA